MSIEKISNAFAYFIIPIWFIALLIFAINAKSISPLWFIPIIAWFIVMVADFSNTVKVNAKAEVAIVKEYTERMRKNDSEQIQRKACR